MIISTLELASYLFWTKSWNIKLDTLFIFLISLFMKEYKVLIIYTISNDQSKKSFEEELERYRLERVGTQDIFALPLEEYRTKVQAFKAYLRAYVRKHLDSQDTVLFVESRMNEERTLTAMLQTNLMSEEE